MPLFATMCGADEQSGEFGVNLTSYNVVLTLHLSDQTYVQLVQQAV